jgi:hypothetical protein
MDRTGMIKNHRPHPPALPDLFIGTFRSVRGWLEPGKRLLRLCAHLTAQVEAPHCPKNDSLADAKGVGPARR